MLESKENLKSPDWFPKPNQLLLIVLAGTLFVSQAPFHGGRPTDKQKQSVATSIAARPYQDPFEPILEIAEKYPQDLDKVATIQKSIGDKILGNHLKQINVVAVMLPGDPYFEDSETRRRLRYSVLSGFNASLRYMPESDSKIQYFVSENKENYVVAYEWLVYKPTYQVVPKSNERYYQLPPVLVLWLNAGDFSITPYKKLQNIITSLDGTSKNVKNLNTDIKPNIGTISVLGPYDSDGLQDLINDVHDKKGSKTEDDNFFFYSPSATISDTSLQNTNPFEYFRKRGINFQRVTATDDHLAITIKNELKLRGIEPGQENRILLVGEWDTLYNWHLGNTFADALLKGREKDCKDEKGNLQNWDEHYDPKDQCIFRSIYLRGLDGEKKNVFNENGATLRASINTPEAKADISETLEDASGDSQFDYVRRLANQVEELDNKIRHNESWHFHDTHAIKAIGILGSDVYDKLLIAEALHGKIPDAVFFTNGMDARFLEPKNNKWARNMIMASSFGLTLNEYLQNGIPPFRDNNQTAFFLATEMALAKLIKLGKFNGKNNIDSKEYFHIKQGSILPFSASTQCEMDNLMMPDQMKPTRLFEIGRTQAIDLSSNNDCGLGKASLHPIPISQKWRITHLGGIFIGIFLLLPTFSSLRRFFSKKSGLIYSVFIVTTIFTNLNLISKAAHWEWVQPQMVRLGVVCLMAMIYIMFICYIALLNNKLPENEVRGLKAKFVNKTFLSSMFLLAVCLITIWHFVKLLVSLGDGNGEPFELLEGVSMWPSLALRLMAFVLTGYFILKVFSFPKEFKSWLFQHFNLEVQENNAELIGTHKINCKNNVLLFKWMSWENFKPRCLYVFIGALVFYFFGACLLLFFGIPNTPYRGETIYLTDSTLMYGLLAPAFSVLLVLVSITTIKAVEIVELCLPSNLEDGESINWPDETLKKYASRFNLLNGRNDIREWVSMRFIVELTKRIYEFIGYPLVITILLVLSYSSYFDNWNMSMAIKVVLAISIGLLVYWDYRLKKAADESRRNALKSLRTRLFFCQKDNQVARGRQLESLINMIENYDEVVYKSFTQRPIYQNCLLIFMALLSDSFDYASLVSRLFKG